MLFIKNTLQILLTSIALLYSLTLFAQEDNNASILSTNIIIDNVEKNPLNNEITQDLPDYKYYDIEVILFRQNSDSEASSEYWSEAEETQKNDYPSSIESRQSIQNIQEVEPMQNIAKFQAIEGFKPIDDTQNNSKTPANNSRSLLANYLVKAKQFITLNKYVKPLSSEQLVLTKEKEHLKYSKKYQLLAHFGWRQPGFNQNQALPVQLIFDPESDQIFGEIKIVLSRYLHTKVNINLHQQVCRQVVGQKHKSEISSQSDMINKVKIEVQLTEQQNKENLITQNNNSEETEIKTICKQANIQFKQSRKMRSNELHYLDHPVFGLLIQINPVKITANKQTEQVKS